MEKKRKRIREPYFVFRAELSAIRVANREDDRKDDRFKKFVRERL